MRNILMNEVSPSDISKPSPVLFTRCCALGLFVLAIFISSSVVFAATIFVPDDYDTIQKAINFSISGDTVSVAAGTYNGNIAFPAGKNIALVSQNGAGATVIHGDHDGSVVTFAPGNNSTLDGFTITNGSTLGYGGGIFCGSSSSPTIANCIITDNEAFSGGGINCAASSAPFITNSIIQNNSVTGDNEQSNGGGIHASDSSAPTITNCIIKNNTSGRNGGGMAFDTAEPTIVNCTFSNNTATVNGGAISFYNSAPIITNCTFTNNSASGDGGAIACSTPLPGTAVANSILWGDSPDEISCDSEVIPVTYSDIQGGYAGTGNINADPMFVDGENGDFHLLQDSPCIDAGDNSAFALPATDIDGDDREIDDPMVEDTGNGTPPIVDMGADEYFLSSTAATPSTAMPWLLLLLDDDCNGSCISELDSDGDGLTDGVDTCPYDPTPECGQCYVIGEECLSPRQCCSGVCNDAGLGAVCVELDGCRPTGELCSVNNDCCSEVCELFPDAELGRCYNPPGCQNPGEICGEGASNNCCGPDGETGSSEYCYPDETFDISRCVVP